MALAAVLAVAAPSAARDEAQAPYVPTPPAVVDAMLDLADLKAGERLIDLGSGDGHIVIAAARRGATAMGVEIGTDLVRRARECTVRRRRGARQLPARRPVLGSPR